MELFVYLRVSISVSIEFLVQMFWFFTQFCNCDMENTREFFFSSLLLNNVFFLLSDEIVCWCWVWCFTIDWCERFEYKYYVTWTIWHWTYYFLVSLFARANTNNCVQFFYRCFGTNSTFNFCRFWNYSLNILMLNFDVNLKICLKYIFVEITMNTVGMAIKIRKKHL